LAFTDKDMVMKFSSQNLVLRGRTAIDAEKSRWLYTKKMRQKNSGMEHFYFKETLRIEAIRLLLFSFLQNATIRRGTKNE